MGEACGSCSIAAAGMELQGTVFPSTLTPPCSRKTLFLGGAGPFDKFSQITLVARIGGKEFAHMVVENCTEILNKNCLYSQKEEKAAKEFEKLFEPIGLPPGSTVFLTYCASGHLMITISKDTSVPEAENRVIDSRNLTEAVLASIIGENGVSPAAKLSLASRMHDIMNSS